MKKSHLFATLFACALAGAHAEGFAQTSWDGFVAVSASPVGDGSWRYCMEGRYKANPDRCVTDLFFSIKDSGGPERVSLQQIVDRVSKAPAGTRWVAVGPMPAFMSGRAPVVSQTEIFIAYRVEKIQ